MLETNLIEWINKEEACKLLGIKKITIIANVSRGDIPRSFYTLGVGNKRFYNKACLMGIDELANSYAWSSQIKYKY